MPYSPGEVRIYTTREGVDYRIERVPAYLGPTGYGWSVDCNNADGQIVGTATTLKEAGAQARKAIKDNNITQEDQA